MMRNRCDSLSPIGGMLRPVYAAVWVALGLFLSQPIDARASMIFDSGTVETFSGTVVGNTAINDSPAGDPTTVVLTPSGDLQGQTIVQGSSELDIQGGLVGTVTGDLLASGDAAIRLNRGIVFQGLRTAGDSLAVIKGGLIGQDLGATGSSLVELRGGFVLGDLIATNSGVLTVYGQNFALDGMPIGPGFLAADGELTGTLQFDFPVNNQVVRTGEGRVLIVETEIIPEPTTIALLASVSIGVLRRRTR